MLSKPRVLAGTITFPIGHPLFNLPARFGLRRNVSQLARCACSRTLRQFLDVRIFTSIWLRKKSFVALSDCGTCVIAFSLDRR
jgi:hypothetical protein